MISISCLSIDTFFLGSAQSHTVAGGESNLSPNEQSSQLTKKEGQVFVLPIKNDKPKAKAKALPQLLVKVPRQGQGHVLVHCYTAVGQSEGY